MRGKEFLHRPPRYKGKYIELEPQLLAYATLKGCDIAFEPNQEAEGVYSDNEAKMKKQKAFVKRNLHAIVVLNHAFPAFFPRKKQQD